MSKAKARCVGIDVSKDKLDVFAQGRCWQISQDRLEVLLEQLLELQPDWVILEPTGGYEIPVANALSQAGLRVARPHVTRMSYHARGRKAAKTDKLDAQSLAHFGECYQEELREYRPDQNQQLLRSLYQRRHQLVGMRSQEKNRSHHQELPEVVREGIVRMITCLDEQIKELDEQLAACIADDEALRQKQALLQTVPGIGQTAATGLLALMPELGQAKRKQIGALAGVVPVVRSSGKWQGQSRIGGGRWEVRQLLYMSALSAIRHCPQISLFYTRLRENGKSGKQAVVACMHKMLRMMNAMLKSQQPYQNPD